MKNTYNEGHLADKSNIEIENTIDNSDLFFNRIKSSDVFNGSLYFDFKNFMNFFLENEEYAKNYLLKLDEDRLDSLYVGLGEYLSYSNIYDGYREKVNEAFEMLEKFLKSNKKR